MRIDMGVSTIVVVATVVAFAIKLWSIKNML